MPADADNRPTITLAAVAVSMRLRLEPPMLRMAMEVLEAMVEVDEVTLAEGSNWEYPRVWVTLSQFYSPLGAINQMKHNLTTWARDTGVDLIDLDGRPLASHTYTPVG